MGLQHCYCCRGWMVSELLLLITGPCPPRKSQMDCRNVSENSKEISNSCLEPDSLLPPASGSDSCSSSSAGQRVGTTAGRPAAANAARERSRVQTLRQAFLELQRTLPSVPPDTKLSKLDVLLLATTYIAHLTRSLQDEEELPGEGLGTLRGDGYLHPVKKWPMRSRLYIGATGQFLNHSVQAENANQGETSTNSQS
ncbi:transcription factor 24 isoform X1 [Mauremys mutica]|nr:transcription factor 24 [Mauremys reevesii]XP_044862307.1 transcription factor 24 isoform X1 [Mauremys mutica]